jgi:LuxR family transcriptional regulator, maltose regulon positive regulatory protein
LLQTLVDGTNKEQAMPTTPDHSPNDLLLATKFNLPHLRSSLVRRSHLTERLQQGGEEALTLISAPAGFGKTTLLAQWLAENNTPVAWLSLEQEDNDPTRFLSYVIAALQTVDAQIGITALALLHTLHPPPPETLITLLTNDLASHATGDVILVLDDYHVIDAEPIHRAMTFLVEHLPPNMHLVLATRADPPLPLARMRARGQLTEVRASDLRFSAAEAGMFLQGMMGFDLSEEALVGLERRTEGWIAGLQLAALSMRGRSDISSFLTAFSGSHRFVLDYLSEEVFASQPAHIRFFLLHTCLLERLSGSLCDAVTGMTGGQAMLEWLDKANLFLVSLDDERQWYRYHHLFAEVLRHHLEQTEPALVLELHQRASAWYEQQGLFGEAIHHALAASDFEHAADLIEKSYKEIALHGNVHLVLGWIKMLPDELVRARPSLSIYYADLLMFTHEMEAAEARLQDAEQSLEKNKDTLQGPMILGPIATIRAIIARYSGDLERSVSLAHQALDVFPETEVDWRASAMVNAAHSYLVSGDVTPASERLVAEAVELARSSGDLFLILRSMTLFAWLEVLRGHLREAAVTYEKAAHTIPERQVLQALTGGAAYYFGMGDVLREWHQLDEAEGYLTAGMELVSGRLTVFADEVTLGYMASARLHYEKGDYSSAIKTLDAFEQLARQRRFVSHLLERVSALKAQLELARGNLASAARWADESGLSIYDEDLSYLHERAYLTLARVRIAQAIEEPAGSLFEDALHLLDRLLENAEAKVRMGSALEILLPRSLALQARRDRKGALATLQRALTLAAPAGYVRLFVDEGEPMLTLLRLAQSHGIMSGYVATLLAAFGEWDATSAGATLPESKALVEPLTEREREVLRLLYEGASNREIARRLVVTVNTVKKHVFNICGKLGAQNRTQAIAKARTLNLK